MANIRVDSSFSKITHSKTRLSVKAKTIYDSIRELEKEFPGIQSAILDSNQNLNNFVHIYVDKMDIRYGDGLNTSLNDNSKVHILKVVAGG